MLSPSLYKRYTEYTKYIYDFQEKRYTIYTGDNMKKSEFVSFRTNLETKEELAKIAASKKWSVSLLVEDIVQQWLEQQKNKKA